MYVFQSTSPYAGDDTKHTKQYNSNNEFQSTSPYAGDDTIGRIM